MLKHVLPFRAIVTNRRCERTPIDPAVVRALSNVGLNLRPLTESVEFCSHIFRTGDVTAIDARGAQLLRDELGVRQYVDLRTDSERQKYGLGKTLEEQGISTIWHPVASCGGGAVASCRPTAEAYSRYYLAILDELSPLLPGLFRCIIAMDGMPFMFGCHAGKDRTGLVAMLLLHVCGADTETIARDHERSRDYLLPHIDRFQDKWERKGETREDYAFRLTSHAESLRRVILILNVACGGIGGYLNHCGVTERQQRTVRERYSACKSERNFS